MEPNEERRNGYKADTREFKAVDAVRLAVALDTRRHFR
jgi:hypothetical protein